MNAPTSLYLRAQEPPAALNSAWLDEEARLPEDPRASLGRVIRILLYRKWRFLLVCAPILLGGLGYLLIVPDRYAAHGTVMVGFRQPDLLTADQARDPIRGEPDIDGAIALMRAHGTLRRVVEQLNLAALPEFRSAAGRDLPLLSRLHRLATTLLRQPSAAPGEIFRPNPVDAIVDRLRKELKIDRIGRSALVDVSYSSPDPALAVRVVNAVAGFSSEDESFLSRMTPADRAGFQIIKTSIVSEAVVGQEAYPPNMNLILAATVFGALAAGFAAVAFKEVRARRTVVSIEELTRRGLRVLALMPKDRIVGNCGSAAAGLAARDRTLAFSAAVDSLQAAVSTLPRLRSDAARILLITSALDAEGKSTTAVALATAMASRGDRVLVLDADLRRAALSGSFALDAAPGSADAVDAPLSPEWAVRQDPTTGVHFLAAREARLRPLGVHGLAALRTQLDVWRRQFDAILINSPSLLTAGDTRILAQLSDYVILVVRWGGTTWAALDRALLALRESGAQLAGVAVSRVNVKQLSAYDFPDPRIYGFDNRSRRSVWRRNWGVDTPPGPSIAAVRTDRAEGAVSIAGGSVVRGGSPSITPGDRIGASLQTDAR